MTGSFDPLRNRLGSVIQSWIQSRILYSALGQGGFTLPFVLVMIALSLVAISSVTLLATHFRSIASAEDGERLYYAMDAGIEAAMADLIRGADLLNPAYNPPELDVNNVRTTVTIDSPGESTNLEPIFQYFDPANHPATPTLAEVEQAYGDDIPYWRAFQHKGMELEPRSPVNINTASRELIKTLLTGMEQEAVSGNIQYFHVIVLEFGDMDGVCTRQGECRICGHPAGGEDHGYLLLP